MALLDAPTQTMERDSTRFYREARRAKRLGGSDRAADALATAGAQAAATEPTGLVAAGTAQRGKELRAYQQQYEAAGQAGYGASKGGAPAGNQMDEILYGKKGAESNTPESTMATNKPFKPAYSVVGADGQTTYYDAAGEYPNAPKSKISPAASPAPDVVGTIGKEGKPAGLVLREMREKAMQDFKEGKGPEPFGPSKSERDYAKTEAAATAAAPTAAAGGVSPVVNARAGTQYDSPSMDMGRVGDFLYKKDKAAATPTAAAAATPEDAVTVEATKARNPIADSVSDLYTSARPYNTARRIAGKALPDLSKFADTFAITKARKASKLGGKVKAGVDAVGAAPAATKIAGYAKTGANVLRPLAPVATALSKGAGKLNKAMEVADTLRFFADPNFQEETIQDMEDFGNRGRQAFGEDGTLGQKASYIGESLGQGLTTMKPLLALGAQSTKMRGSMNDAAQAEASADTAQNRFEATQAIINQPEIQEQLKTMPFGSKERSAFLQNIRKRVQVR